MYKNPRVETQDPETFSTLKHALAVNDNKASQNIVLKDTAAHLSLSRLTKISHCHVRDDEGRVQTHTLKSDASMNRGDRRNASFKHFPSGYQITQRRLEEQLLSLYLACVDDDNSNQSAG